MNKDCARAEILAGAIALGEASDTERDDYRRHISACSPCLTSLGGEREIERVMATVADARESEVWEPVAMPAGERRARKIRFAWTFGASTVAAAFVVSFGIHTLIAANTQPITIADAPQTTQAQPFHVSLERRYPLAPAPKPKAPAQPNIVVVHNVITLNQNDKPETKTPVRTTETTVAAKAPAETSTETVAQTPVNTAASNVPVWRRSHALPRAEQPESSTIARTESAPILAGRAESIAVAPSYIVRDAVPIGGDTAINPRPAPIAYAMGAEGTTAFEVTIDERGAPVKCTITKTSGYLVLDDAVCKAAMQARYSPRLVNGRATSGIYRDAFTFRASNNNDAQL